MNINYFVLYRDDSSLMTPLQELAQLLVTATAAGTAPTPGVHLVKGLGAYIYFRDTDVPLATVQKLVPSHDVTNAALFVAASPELAVCSTTNAENPEFIETIIRLAHTPTPASYPEAPTALPPLVARYAAVAPDVAHDIKLFTATVKSLHFAMLRGVLVDKDNKVDMVYPKNPMGAAITRVLGALLGARACKTYAILPAPYAYAIKDVIRRLTAFVQAVITAARKQGLPPGFPDDALATALFPRVMDRWLKTYLTCMDDLAVSRILWDLSATLYKTIADSNPYGDAVHVFTTQATTPGEEPPVYCTSKGVS